uniref:Uncharacterized protein n=1 Tax=Timema cristinae TaxID=61476 RepID=A0A7R9CG15_TIMCR|nr:unnamed protein product [Timema cristinae]
MAPIIGSVCEQRIAKDREDLLMEKRGKIALSSPNRKQVPYMNNFAFGMQKALRQTDKRHALMHPEGEHESKFQQYRPIGHTVWFAKIKDWLSRFARFWNKETKRTYY